MPAVGFSFAPRDRFAGIPLGDGLFETCFLSSSLKCHAFRAVAGESVKQGSECLGAGKTHIVVRLIDQHLRHRQLIFGDTLDALYKALDLDGDELLSAAEIARMNDALRQQRARSASTS